MRAQSILALAGALFCAGAASPAFADGVYKCGLRSYSYQPCSNRTVNTDDAPVPAKPRLNAGQAPGGAVRHLPGETQAQFATRQRRASLQETDRDECSRLDTRIPFEKERLKSPRPEEVEQAQKGLAESQRRFSQLRC
jgi:hypothetical protein